MSSLVVRLAVENTQNSKEEVDDVEVKADSSRNLLLDVMLAQDHLGVDENIATEEKSTDAAIDELDGGAVREEHGHEAEEEDTPESTEEVGHPRGEVVLGLAGKEGEEDENASGEEYGV